jgi:hypothetical protein
MKIITSLSTLSLIFAGVLLAACNLQKSTKPDVYVAGHIEMPGDEVVRSVSVFTGRDTTLILRNKYYATVWKNGVAQKLTDGTNNAGALSVFVFGSDVYVAGYDGNVATVWKNGEAQNLTDGTYEAKANSVFVSENDAYVAGYFETPGEQEYTAKVHRPDKEPTIETRCCLDKSYATVWKNGVAQILTDGTDQAKAHSIFVSGNDVYVAGIENISGRLWKNGVAQKLTDIRPNSVFVSGNDVYLAGTGANKFKFEGDTMVVPYSLIWKNGVTQRFTDEDISIKTRSSRDNLEFSNASSVFVSGNDVYVLGSFGKRYASESSVIVWKNGEAQILADGSLWGDASVFVYDNDVYVTFGRVLIKNGIAQNLDVDESAISFKVFSVFVK